MGGHRLKRQLHATNIFSSERKCVRDTGEACIMLLPLSWVEEYSTGCSKLHCQGKQLSDATENMWRKEESLR